MKVQHRCWEIASDDSIKIRIRESLDGGVRHPLVEVLSVTLRENRNRERVLFDGALKVKDADKNLLDQVSQHFVINIEGEAIPFREIRNCSKIGQNDTELTFASCRIASFNNGPDIKIQKRIWEITLDGGPDPREIYLKGRETKKQVCISYLKIIESNKGEKYTVIPEPGFDEERIGDCFDIILNSIKGDPSPFDGFDDCHKVEGEADYQVAKENVRWKQVM